MKEKKLRGIFIFDHCYSGNFPHRLIDAGFDAQAIAPVAEGKESQCQFFIPIFFDALKDKVDFDNDGSTRIVEAFKFAMERYKNETAQEGVIRESIPELHEKNLASFQKETSKPLVIEITATWCTWCKKMEPELNRIRTLYFDTLDIYKLTIDENPKAQEILKAMKVEEEGLPTLVFVRKQEKSTVYSGYKETHEITELIEKEFGKLIDSQKIDKEVQRVYLPEYAGKEIPKGRFTLWELVELKKKGIEIEIALTYDQRFNGYEIASLVEAKISPEVANKNDYKDLSATEIIAINKSQ